MGDKFDEIKVLNLLSTGGVGGIEKLCKDIGQFSDFDNTFVFLFDEGTIYEEMENSGLNTISLKEFGKKKFDFRRLRELIKIAKSCDIINVHHSTISIQIYYFLLKLLLPKKKYVLTAHSCFDHTIYFNYKSRLKNYIRKIVLNAALKVSDEIVFVSNAGMKSYTDVFDLVSKKKAVIYNGIRNQPERLNKTNNSSSIVITYVGRLVEGKGVQYLIKAVEQLCDKYSLCVYIVGDGEYRQSLEKLAKGTYNPNIFKFQGQRRNVYDYLMQSDLFVYPSIWQEVFGISIVEAMDYGVPCVAFRVGGIPEIIENNKNGYIVDDITVDSLAEGIEKAINNLVKKGNIRANCYATAEKFSMKNTVDSMKNNYLHLLGKK